MRVFALSRYLWPNLCDDFGTPGEAEALNFAVGSHGGVRPPCWLTVSPESRVLPDKVMRCNRLPPDSLSDYTQIMLRALHFAIINYSRASCSVSRATLSAAPARDPQSLLE
ncbi:hypothetical protein EVAR_11877_1 [Eumeta japonica]|uniref:Uncharacterized protein n=1 Tax=Eumeta variegata TaxID=151549 RepID=A0A4C1U7Q1_EUMVA|nr:hypothetical protein EVAR_11877_1 [Eumeta japonica]